jgi:hypothetical protein
MFQVVLGSLVVSMLASGPTVHRFRSGQRQWIFRGDENPQHDFHWMGSQPVRPMQKEFTAC